MNSHYQVDYRGEERRSSLGRQFRHHIDEEVTQLRMLYSSLHQGKQHSLPAESILAIEAACVKAAEKIQKLGFPKHRIEDIRKQVS
jgi:hypothetical protein